MPFDRLQPYNDLPLLPPPVELETKAVLKQAINTNRVLANLRGLAAQIPNQGVLINSIVLQEARLSSEIENIVTTNDELYRADADADGKTDSHTKEVLRYRQALNFGFKELAQRPLSTNLFIDIVRIIKEVDFGVRRVPGTALKNAMDEVIYAPPVGESVNPQRANYRQVLLPFRLREAIQRLNPGIPTAAREDALQRVLDLGIPALLPANRAFYKLMGSVPVQYQKDDEEQWSTHMDWFVDKWSAVN